MTITFSDSQSLNNEDLHVTFQNNQIKIYFRIISRQKTQKYDTVSSTPLTKNFLLTLEKPSPLLGWPSKNLKKLTKFLNPKISSKRPFISPLITTGYNWLTFKKTPKRFGALNLRKAGFPSGTKTFTGLASTQPC